MSTQSTIHIDDFEKYIADWIKMSVEVTNHQPAGLQSRKLDITLCVNFLKLKKVKEITTSDLFDFLKYVRTERGNSPASANRKRSTLRTYIRHLRMRNVPGSLDFPVECIPVMRKGYKGELYTLEPEEVRFIIDSIDASSLHGCRDRIIVSMLYGLGIRIGEVAAVNIADIDFDKKVIMIHGKGRKEREIALTEEMITLLLEWLILRKQYAGAKRQDALFLSQKGNRLAVRTIQDNFKKLIEPLKPFTVNTVTPHSLRHAFASHALEDDSSDHQLVILKHVLGHALLKSTLIYARPSLRVLRRAITDHLSTEILQQIIESNVIPIRTHQKRRKSA